MEDPELSAHQLREVAHVGAVHDGPDLLLLLLLLDALVKNRHDVIGAQQVVDEALRRLGRRSRCGGRSSSRRLGGLSLVARNLLGRLLVLLALLLTFLFFFFLLFFLFRSLLTHW